MYAQNGISERDCDVCLEPQLPILILHVALTQKGKISDSSRLVCRSLVYAIQLEHEGKERRKKNKIKILMSIYLTVRRINETLGYILH